MTLHQLDTPTRTLPPRRVVFGVPMTREEALDKALTLHRRRDFEGSARVLDEAGLWVHDLIEWSRNAE